MGPRPLDVRIVGGSASEAAGGGKGGGGSPATEAEKLERIGDGFANRDRRARNRFEMQKDKKAEKEKLSEADELKGIEEKYAQQERRGRNRFEMQKDKKAEAEEKSKERETDARRNQFKSAVAGAAATAIRGGETGATIGGAVGAGVGSRFGTAGALVGQAVGEKAGGTVDKAGQAASSFGVSVAKGEGVELANKAVGTAATAAAAGLATIPGVGLPAAAALLVFKDTVGQAHAVLSAFAQRGRELAGYSGQIAGAAAMQDVNRTLADIKEAQRFGDQYGKVIEAQTRFEGTLKAGLNPIKEWLLDRLPEWLDKILELLIKMAEILAKFTPGDMVDKIVKEMKEVKEALTGGDGGGPGGGADLVNKWLAAPMIGGFPMPAAPPAPGPLGIPIIPVA
jgi:hypothetical protein